MLNLCSCLIYKGVCILNLLICGEHVTILKYTYILYIYIICIYIYIYIYICYRILPIQRYGIFQIVAKVVNLFLEVIGSSDVLSVTFFILHSVVVRLHLLCNRGQCYAMIGL